MKKIFAALVLIFASALSMYADGGKYTEDDIGKIVLKNGKLVSSENYNKASFQAVAIVYRIADDGSYFLGIGINTTNAQWATEESYGYLGRIRGLEDLKDGYKAFSIVKQADPEGFKNLEENYPALYYAATYGKRYNVGPYTEGWYIPTSTEAGFQYRLPCRTWEQMEKIKASFQLFNDTWPFEFWVSNSVWRENSYDPYYGMYFWKEVPKDTKFALNSISPWCDCGAYPYYNSSKYPVIVMRKFY